MATQDTDTTMDTLTTTQPRQPAEGGMVFYGDTEREAQDEALASLSLELERVKTKWPDAIIDTFSNEDGTSIERIRLRNVWLVRGQWCWCDSRGHVTAVCSNPEVRIKVIPKNAELTHPEPKPQDHE